MDPYEVSARFRLPIWNQVARYIPLQEMDEQHPRRLLHALEKNTGFWSHRRVGKFERVEVHHGVENTIGCGWPAADENRQTVQSSIYYEGITISRVVQLVDFEKHQYPKLDHTCCCPGAHLASCPVSLLPRLQVA